MQQAQLDAQQQQAAASLAEQQREADAQSTANQQQFDYQKAQDAQRQADTQAQADRQTTVDQSRASNATRATNSINAAFAQFSPAYFQQYQNDYYSQADDEINRQYGLAQKDLRFGLARSGNLDSTTGADQTAKLAETKGRAETDQANAAATAASDLSTKVTSAKTGLLDQALSTNTLGNPIAGGSSDAVNASIDTANRAVTAVSNTAGDYVTGIKAVAPTTGSLAGLFGAAAGSGANALAGAQDARIAAAYGGSSPSATGTGNSSTRIY